MSCSAWPDTADELISLQRELGALRPSAWRMPEGACAIGGCFVCFTRGSGGRGARGEPGWAGAAVAAGGQILGAAVVAGQAGARYDAGLLALREGPLLERAVRALPHRPDVLLVNATGRDHPRRAGLATHLGAVLDLPTVGVTHRPLLAAGSWPGPQPGERSPLRTGEEQVGWWLRTRRCRRPLAVHPGWRVDLESACAVVLAAAGPVRTPVPLREARRIARRARAAFPLSR